MVKLVPVTRLNWVECSKIELHTDQQEFVPDALHCIAESQFYPQTMLRGVIDMSSKIVGLVAFGLQEGDGACKIFRMLIDKNEQRKGYGRQALTQTMEFLTSRFPGAPIELCYHPRNAAAETLYLGMGFQRREILPCELTKEGKVRAVIDFKQA